MKDSLDHLMDVMEAAFEPRWREAWTRRQVADSLAMPSTYSIVIDTSGAEPEPDGTAAGFILVRHAPGEEELLLVGVRPEFRGRGLGQKLLDIFADTARAAGAERIFLEMRANNPAETLYRRAGFEPIGRRKAYYTTSDGERIDAITFGKILY